MRARLGPARVVAVEGNTVVLMLPNERAVQRGSELLPAAREALIAALGRSVDLDLQVGAPDPRPGDRRVGSGGPLPAPDEPHDDEDVGDVATLVDADAGPTDDLERVAEVFPGIELVETDPGATS